MSIPVGPGPFQQNVYQQDPRFIRAIPRPAARPAPLPAARQHPWWLNLKSMFSM